MDIDIEAPQSLLSLVSQLCNLLHNADFPAHLSSAIRAFKQDSNTKQKSGLPQAIRHTESEERLLLRIDASICTEVTSPQEGTLHLGCIDLQNGKLVDLPQPAMASPQSNDSPAVATRIPLTPESISSPSDSYPSKRRKTVSSLRLAPTASVGPTDQAECANGSQLIPLDDLPEKQTVRQVHSIDRFPQRKKPVNYFAPPTLEPTSADKLIAGIWRQVHSPVQLSRASSIPEPIVNIRTGVSKDVFRAVNTLCLKYYNQSQSLRALEMIVQAYWIECYEARIAVIQLEDPSLSATKTRLAALKEACVALNWKEKELRNRIAVWRGYKEIKDAGGWASLIFASAGVYRFCKYRTGFGEGLTSRLRELHDSLEVAADTLHPEWRDLLQVIGQVEPRRYNGHPHEWVTVPGAPAIPLVLTYDHLQLPNGFQYQFIDDCVLDTAVFGTVDPRRVPEYDPEFCPVCRERQSDKVETNQCACFPTLFGGVRSPVPVQIFRTANGKNNGVIARSNFERGTVVGEFVGLVTNGIEGVDVMLGGTRSRSYQIFQGQMGNFTRFINHSCRPNTQFQRFYWRGLERIVVVSRGVMAGSEITVDYSNQYWRQLEKKCLCGEPCCRFERGR